MKLITSTLVAFTLFFTSCATSIPEENTKLTIGFVTFPGYAPFYIAQEKGFYNNTHVELVRIESIPDLRAALRSGKIDAFAATYDMYLSNADSLANEVGILALDRSYGADGLIAAENITSIQDLKGREVAAEFGFPAHFLLKVALHEQGMTIHDIQLRDFPTQDACHAFVAKRFDVIGSYEPCMSTSIRERAGSKLLLSSKDSPVYIQDLLFTSPEVISNKQGALQNLVQGWIQAVEFTKSNKEEATTIMAKSFDLNIEDMREFEETIRWHNLEENKQLLLQHGKNTAYDMIEQVQTILSFNNDHVHLRKAENIINPTFIHSFKNNFYGNTK